MKHFKAIVIKFIMITGVLLVVLGGLYQVSLMNIITTSVMLTGISYILGDLLILPNFENWGATIADFSLSFVGIWLLGIYLYTVPVPFPAAAGISALLIAGGEYFFHQYMANHVLRKRLSGTGLAVESPQYQTEFSSELDDDSKKDNYPK